MQRMSCFVFKKKHSLLSLLDDTQRGVLFQSLGQSFGRAIREASVAEAEHFEARVDFQRLEQPVGNRFLKNFRKN